MGTADRATSGLSTHGGNKGRDESTAEGRHLRLFSRLSAVAGRFKIQWFLDLLSASEERTTWAWVLGYTAALSVLSGLRYYLWIPGDGWIYQQGMWMLLHRGIRAASTYWGAPILADDTAYVLLPLALVYHLGGVYIILILQAFAFGLGYFFIRRIGSTLSLSSRVSHLVGLVYLMYPAVIGANLFDFHPDALGVPLLFGLMWSALANRWSMYIVLAFASLVVKDTVPIVIFGMGVALVLKRQWAWGPVTMAIGLIAAYLDVSVVIPALSHAQMPQWPLYFGYLGPTPAAGAAHLLRNPATLLNWVGHGNAWTCLTFLFGPLIAILIISRSSPLTPFWLPGLALSEVNLLSLHWTFRSPYTEEYVLAVPSFFVAMLVSLTTGRTGGLNRWIAVSWLILPACALLVAGAIASFGWRHRPVNTDVLHAAVTAVPGDAPVLAQDIFSAHVADRERLWTIDFLANDIRFPAGTYVVLDTSNTPTASWQVSQFQARLSSMTEGRAFDVIFSDRGVKVYRLLQPLPFTSKRAQ